MVRPKLLVSEPALILEIVDMANTVLNLAQRYYTHGSISCANSPVCLSAKEGDACCLMSFL